MNRLFPAFLMRSGQWIKTHITTRDITHPYYHHVMKEFSLRHFFLLFVPFYPRCLTQKSKSNPLIQIWPYRHPRLVRFLFLGTVGIFLRCKDWVSLRLTWNTNFNPLPGREMILQNYSACAHFQRIWDVQTRRNLPPGLKIATRPLSRFTARFMPQNSSCLRHQDFAKKHKVPRI